MKPFKYYRSETEGQIFYICDTDFSKYEYKPSLSIFKKGWFREHENEVVLMITNLNKSTTQPHSYFYFEDLKTCLEYIKPMLI